MSKHRSHSLTPRLARVLEEIEFSGTTGITTYKLQILARVTGVADCVYELRGPGHDIVGEWEEKHRRYWTAAHRILNPLCGGRAVVEEGTGP